jgi:hypothetical protein
LMGSDESTLSGRTFRFPFVISFTRSSNAMRNEECTPAPVAGNGGGVVGIGAGGPFWLALVLEGEVAGVEAAAGT